MLSPTLNQVANITVEDLKNKQQKKSIRFTTWFISWYYLFVSYKVQPKYSSVLVNIAPRYIPYIKEAASITSIIFSKAVFVVFAQLFFTKLSLVKEKENQRKKTKRKLRLLSYSNKPGWAKSSRSGTSSISPFYSLSFIIYWLQNSMIHKTAQNNYYLFMF